MNENDIGLEAERIIRQLTDDLLGPRPGECLLCFVDRQLDTFGCDGTHRFTKHFRSARAPRATGLLQRLAAQGACCCDCEIFCNAYVPVFGLWEQYALTARPSEPDDEPRDRPPCAGVRAGSTQPCWIWQRRRRRR